MTPRGMCAVHSCAHRYVLLSSVRAFLSALAPMRPHPQSQSQSQSQSLSLPSATLSAISAGRHRVRMLWPSAAANSSPAI